MELTCMLTKCAQILTKSGFLNFSVIKSCFLLSTSFTIVKSELFNKCCTWRVLQNQTVRCLCHMLLLRLRLTHCQSHCHYKHNKTMQTAQWHAKLAHTHTQTTTIFTCVSYAEARNRYRTSVRPSHAGTVSKRLNILSSFLHHTIAHSF